MPTEAEIFERTYTVLRKGLSHPCVCRNTETPGKCGYCQGSGVDPLDGEECPTCLGSGVCWQCGGTLDVVPDPLDPTLNLALFVSWINAMSLSRSEENYVRFSEQWDVLEAYVQGITKLSAEQTTPEEMRDMLVRMVAPEEPDEPEKPKEPNAGALSPEDLRVLGIQED